MEERLTAWGYQPLIDRNQLRRGDFISDFMRRIGRGDHVLVILSEKYLRSPYCMTELKHVYDRSLGVKNDFVRRVVPVVLPCAKIDTWRDQDEHSRYWENEFQDMKQVVLRHGVEFFQRFALTRDLYTKVSDILSFISDKLTPRTWEDITRDDFAAVRAMLPPISRLT